MHWQSTQESNWNTKCCTNEAYPLWHIEDIAEVWIKLANIWLNRIPFCEDLFWSASATGGGCVKVKQCWKPFSTRRCPGQWMTATFLEPPEVDLPHGPHRKGVKRLQKTDAHPYSTSASTFTQRILYLESLWVHNTWLLPGKRKKVRAKAPVRTWTCWTILLEDRWEELTSIETQLSIVYTSLETLTSHYMAPTCQTDNATKAGSK